MKLVELFIGEEDFGRVTLARAALLGFILELGWGEDVGHYLRLGAPWLRRGPYSRRPHLVTAEWCAYADGVADTLKRWWARCGWNAGSDA
jgi:hypothetical protein